MSKRHNATPQLLNAKISGSGPVILLLHGYLSSLGYWDDLRRTLEGDYTVVAVDLLGFGNSPKPKSSDYSYDEHIAAIRYTLGHYGLEEPTKLIGHSMGAQIALHYASDNKASADRLLLLNMPLFSSAKEARKELAGTGLLYRISLYWGLHRLIWPALRMNVSKRVLKRILDPNNFWIIEESALKPSAEARSRSLHNVVEQPSIDELKSLKIPATLVVGLKDRSVYRANIPKLTGATKLKVLLADTGHSTLSENFDFAIKLI